MTRATALITGASGGLGHAVSTLFLAQGWRVVAPVRPGTAPTGLPEGVANVVADLTDPAAVGAAVEVATAAPTAPLTAVVNLVGGFRVGARVHETPLDDFDAMITMNLRPTYLVTAAALPHLMATGAAAVVCVSAQAAARPFTGAAGYVTAKAAVLAFANAVAVEYQPAGIRSNTIMPGVIDTAGNRRAMPDADRSHWVDPAEVARIVHFLASDESAPTTGAALPVTG